MEIKGLLFWWERSGWGHDRYTWSDSCLCSDDIDDSLPSDDFDDRRPSDVFDD